MIVTIINCICLVHDVLLSIQHQTLFFVFVQVLRLERCIRPAGYLMHHGGLLVEVWLLI